MTSSPGRRVAKRKRTQAALRQVAMGLFVARGFDNVTTTEIARGAGVSTATLFNHFPTKEDLVFGQVDELERTLALLVRSCPAGQSILDALQAHVLFDLTAGRAYTCPSHVAPFHELIANSPQLQAREAQLYLRREAALASALRQRFGSTEAPFAGTVAALFVAAERVIATEMRQRLAEFGRPEQTLRELDGYIEAVFTVIRGGTGDLAPP
ncbi:TetR/AcrR family transcriptional regulator [Jatrophihabitans telluris]|uniref:TetR/AcrR family transcriptional regulator n=1 Tax=Jatrophihabitans telluris TaxID=2038343 RepID=A0ABY4QSS9_9ACTN|nr:TetR/AcrR family transcriptional regulator [Jatrophihabitans telluris]UQX86853.1 TetR/AcrR family transcriptional regulator [Jatrophihabitans telluris]